jgi:hypothetical protein
MSRRLQVVVRDADLKGYERTARAAGLTLSEWVRQTLREAQRDASSGNVDAKLAAVREAVRHSFREPDIETMLAEIEQGYRHADDA